MVGHSLAIARMRLGQLLSTEPSAERRRALEQVAELLREAVEETRSLTFELSSLVLSELGLEPALRSLGERMAEVRGFEFELVADRRPRRLSKDAETILYRVVEELLVNVAKHSRARSVRLSIERADGAVRLAVEDDGVGFDPAAVRARLATAGCLGLYGLQQRLDHLGGRLEIDSAPAEGARTAVFVPLAEVDA